jgi:UDP-GlcNAc:undecaprenyl-phosphate GlcNAc-1-phosphate transferase
LSAVLRLPAAFALALVVTVLTVPVAISIARRWRLLDRPLGWKHHAQPTPYLGGAALLCGFSIAAVAFAAGAGLAWLLLCCAGLCVLGTLDDRWGLPASC